MLNEIIKVSLFGTVPIPVGHRVEVQWFSQKKTRLLGGRTDKPIEMPLVTDQTTGIRYAPDTLYSDRFATDPYAINVKEHTLRTDLTVSRRVTGIVLFCSIAVLAGDQHCETELRLEVSSNESPLGHPI